MPIYEFKCTKGHKFERFLKLADYKEPQTCDCGSGSRRILSLPMINCDIQPWDYYESPASGKPITSYKDRKKDMAESGCVDYEPSVAKYAERDKRKAELEMDRKIEQTVTKEIQAMSCDKREKLGNELASGADCVPERYTYGE